MILPCLTAIATPAEAQKIEEYSAFSGFYRSGKIPEEGILLRKFIRNQKTCYLAVSPLTLSTCLVSPDTVRIEEADWTVLRSRYASSPYIRALAQVAGEGSPLQNAGITGFSHSQAGIDLTIDLCPSHRPLDRNVFTDLIKDLGNIERPVPVSISITGIWMKEHPDDLAWLTDLQKSGDLDILWINHTFDHFTSKELPLNQNFMLAKGTDVEAEVLKTEAALLERGLIPSVFFRFPGLVSDRQVVDRILGFGLIPVGSDAWLAKGQWPENGSIVLIHANGNEPLGVKDFIELLKKEQSAVVNKAWELYDLRKSLVSEGIRN